MGDITYVRLKHRFIYVALLMDVFTRMIRGWKLSQHLTQSLTLEPLEQALDDRVPEIHHSDQGAQYLSSAYIATLQEHRIEISVAQRGRPWENGYAERLIRTLKEEEVDINDYDSIAEARDRIGHFITQVYNQKRPHSALGYLTPIEFQRQTLLLTLLIFGRKKRWHFIHPSKNSIACYTSSRCMNESFLFHFLLIRVHIGVYVIR